MYCIEINLENMEDVSAALHEVANLIKNGYTNGILDDGSTWSIEES